MKSSPALRIPGERVMLLCFFWMMSSLAPAFGADSMVMKLETIPATIKLQQGDLRQVMVVARNVSTNTVQLLPLDWIVTPGLSVSVQPTAQPPLAPDAGVHWTVSVSKTNESHEPGQIYFRLDYKRLDSTNGNGIVSSVTSSLEEQDRPLTPLNQLVEVRIESSLTLLRQPQTNTVYVIVKNKGNFPITVDSIKVNSLADISVTDLSEAPLVVPPGERAFPFEISAQNTVHPGKHLVLFEVNLSWKDEGLPQTGKTISKFECDVGVFGDSEFLVPLGVPSFLLLPGFLMLIVFAMLWNLTFTDKFPWTAKSPEFWSVAIIISLFVILLYPFGGSNLLEGYGLKDVYRVWFGSFLVGVGAWLVVFVIVRGLRYLKNLREAEERKKLFVAGDSPQAVLRKLELNNGNLLLDRVNATANAQTQPVFRLGVSNQTVWIASSIAVSFDDAPDNQTKLELSKQFDDLSAQGKPGAVADFLEEKEHSWIKVEWETAGPFRGISELPAASMTQAPGSQRGLLVKRI